MLTKQQAAPSASSSGMQHMTEAMQLQNQLGGLVLHSSPSQHCNAHESTSGAPAVAAVAIQGAHAPVVVFELGGQLYDAKGQPVGGERGSASEQLMRATCTVINCDPPQQDNSKSGSSSSSSSTAVGGGAGASSLPLKPRSSSLTSR
jgi:hypothetical protein